MEKLFESRVSRRGPIQSLSLIIPSYNEAATLETFVVKCLALKGTVANELQIIIVDDGSQDSSLEIARRLSKTYGEIDLVSHSHNLGIGETLQSGYRLVKGEWVTHLPADMQFDPIDLTHALPLIEEADIVFLYRSKRSDVSLLRRFISMTNRLLNRIFFGLKTRDINWVKIYRSWVIQEIRIKSRSPFAESERVIRAFKKGARIKEAPAPHLPRKSGKGRGAKFSTVLKAFLDFVTFVVRR